MLSTHLNDQTTNERYATLYRAACYPSIRRLYTHSNTCARQRLKEQRGQTSAEISELQFDCVELICSLGATLVIDIFSGISVVSVDRNSN